MAPLSTIFLPPFPDFLICFTLTINRRSRFGFREARALVRTGNAGSRVTTRNESLIKPKTVVNIELFYPPRTLPATVTQRYRGSPFLSVSRAVLVVLEARGTYLGGISCNRNFFGRQLDGRGSGSLPGAILIVSLSEEY